MVNANLGIHPRLVVYEIINKPLTLNITGFLGRKSITNLNSVLKNRDITLPTKVSIVKAMVFQWSSTVVRAGW